MAGNSWNVILEQLTESYKNRFSQLDNKDFVKFCVTNKDLRNVVESFLKTKQKQSVCKDSKLADKKRIEGDVEFEKKNYEKSLTLYKEAISYGCQNDENLSLAYWGRSKILFEFGYAPEALQDIEIALSLKHSKERTSDFKFQKYKCLMMMGDVIEAKKVYPEAFKDLQSKESIKSLIEMKSLKFLEENSFKMPEPAGGYNDNFTSASSYLQLHYNSKKGRHVIASQDIKMGDVLFVEKPFAYIVFKLVCHNCCKNIISLIPCWNCRDVSYCSPSCRDSHFKSIHSLECGYGGIFRSVGIAYLSLRIVLSASSSLKELKNSVKKIKEVEYKEGIISFKSRGYDCVYNLVSNFEKYEASDLFQYVMTALLLALHLKNHTNYFENSSSEEDLNFLTSVIAKHIMQLICNGHAIVDTFVERSDESAVESQTEKRVGTAIYPSASMMNHSCEPSIINDFHKNCLVVRAAKDIKKGEEVFNCYGPDARRMKRPKRLEILRKQYFFNCECKACLEPFDMQDKFTAFKCENCKGPLISKDEERFFCIDCKQDTEKSIELVENKFLFFDLMEEGEMLICSDVDFALKKFLQSWLLGRKIFYKYNKNLSRAADEVANCLAHLKNYQMCIKFLKCCILSVEKRFGSNSIELANEIKKLADASMLLINTNYVSKGKEASKKAEEVLSYYNRAGNLFSLLFGPNHPNVKEIERNKENLQAILKKYK